MAVVKSLSINPEAMALNPRMLELLEETAGTISEVMYTHVFDLGELKGYGTEKSQYVILAFAFAFAVDEWLKRLQRSNKAKNRRDEKAN